VILGRQELIFFTQGVAKPEIDIENFRRKGQFGQRIVVHRTSIKNLQKIRLAKTESDWRRPRGSGKI
jgi:hypothetical protein